MLSNKCCQTKVVEQKWLNKYRRTKVVEQKFHEARKCCGLEMKESNLEVFSSILQKNVIGSYNPQNDDMTSNVDTLKPQFLPLLSFIVFFNHLKINLIILIIVIRGKQTR
jgi:hypothetical protein